jgi:hypothetical protein
MKDKAVFTIASYSLTAYLLNFTIDLFAENLRSVSLQLSSYAPPGAVVVSRGNVSESRVFVGVSPPRLRFLAEIIVRVTVSYSDALSSAKTTLQHAASDRLPRFLSLKMACALLNDPSTLAVVGRIISITAIWATRL